MTRSLRIVLVSDTFAPAADPAAETAREVCDALLFAGHQVLVVTATPGKAGYRTAQVVRCRTTPSTAALAATVAAFSPDAVQVVRPRTLGVAAMRATDPTGVPLFVLDPGPLHPRLGTALSSSASGARLLGMVGVESRLWTPGVRADEHHPGLRSPALHDAWARTASPGGPRTVVGYAGPVGVATTKHVRRLQRIAEHDALRLVVLGRGPGTAVLKAAGARIVGECRSLDLARGLASLDVFVQPRKHEAGLGVVRKALACGVPVVAFESAVTAEVVTDGENGLLVAPGQGRGALRDAVLRLAGDADLRAALASRARESVLARSWGDAVDDLVGLYRGAGSVVAVG